MTQIKNLPFYRLKHNESLDDVSKKFNVSLNSLKFYNMVENFEEGDIVFFPQYSSNVYIVKPADTIKSIAKKLSLTESELMAKAKTNKLFIGQRIEY